MGFAGLVAMVTLVYLVVGRLERLPALRFRTLPSPRPYLRTDVAWYGVAVFATAVSVFVLRPQLKKLTIASVSDTVTRLPFLAQLALSVLMFDFVSYVVHRCLHRYDVLWNIHKVHHSSRFLDGFATTRTHMVENMLRFVPGQAVLFLAGMPVRAVAPAVALAAIYGVSNHSNIGLDLRWIEPVLVTPRLHRRHHVPETTQANFGTILTVWDRLAHTLVRRDTHANESFGVPGEIESYPQHFIVAFRRPLDDSISRRRTRRQQHRAATRRRVTDVPSAARR